jgi:hypothetical protein
MEKKISKENLTPLIQSQIKSSQSFSSSFDAKCSNFHIKCQKNLISCYFEDTFVRT